VTAVREALVLPLLLLTAALLGGLHPGSSTTFVPPSLFSLVLATLLVAALVRSGALDPSRLLHPSRGRLANANGAAVLASLFAAAAQVVAMLTPGAGLPRFFVDVFLFVLLVNTIVAQPDRIRVLRSLGVILGASYVLKFIVLSSLGDPSGRTFHLLVALFDAATFGSIAQTPEPASAGYLAFFGAAVFLVGLALLPRTLRGDSSTSMVRRRSS